MWLRDLSLAWRPKSLSGLPLAMENCLRHFPSTFAPYESCIRHSPSLTKLFCFHAFFLFHLQATLRIVQPGAQTPARGILWGGQALGRSSSATSFPSHKLVGGELVCGAVGVRRDDLLYSAAALWAARLLQWKSLETHTVVPRLQLWVRVLSGNVLVAYDCG